MWALGLDLLNFLRENREKKILQLECLSKSVVPFYVKIQTHRDREDERERERDRDLEYDRSRE